MAPDPFIQGLTTASLAYATYLTAKCPCRRLLSCHLNEFAASMGLAIFLVLRENKNNGF